MPSIVTRTATGLTLAALLASTPLLGHNRTTPSHLAIGRHEIATIPFDPAKVVQSATYTPGGKVLVAWTKSGERDQRQINLSTMDDDGSHVHTFFSAKVPERPKDNGLRYMVFADNKRIFLGDFIVECSSSLETCKDAALLPVTYPAQVAEGDFLSHRWSEMVVAPDNRHVAWNALTSDYSVLVFTGELQRTGAGYTIVRPQIVSTLDPFRPDPKHPDGVLPKPFLGGEVKQFVHGGTALSMVGAISRDVPDSVVQSLLAPRKEAITDTPGYTETTIFSPDEKLGLTMTTRFSKATDPAIMGLVPRPYPDTLQMGLSMVAYTYAVTGVRQERPGDVGPALIDIQASKTQPDYQGINLNTSPDWVYYSPMSWAPDSKKAIWLEGKRGGDGLRIQRVTLPDYRAAPPVKAKATPSRIPYASTDLASVERHARAAHSADVKVYGRSSGYLTYRRTLAGVIEKQYVNFSDDGRSTYSGMERLEANPRGRSTYTAKLQLTGPRPGVMDLKMTFGPLGGPRPAELIFTPDAAGVPMTHGYAEYAGRRIDASTLIR